MSEVNSPDPTILGGRWINLDVLFVYGVLRFYELFFHRVVSKYSSESQGHKRPQNLLVPVGAGCVDGNRPLFSEFELGPK